MRVLFFVFLSDPMMPINKRLGFLWSYLSMIAIILVYSKVVVILSNVMIKVEN